MEQQETGETENEVMVPAMKVRKKSLEKVGRPRPVKKIK
jgi:hypothetical protein